MLVMHHWSSKCSQVYSFLGFESDSGWMERCIIAAFDGERLCNNCELQSKQCFWTLENKLSIFFSYWKKTNRYFLLKQLMHPLLYIHVHSVHSLSCGLPGSLKDLPSSFTKHSICLVSDLCLLESLSHAFKVPYTPELILGAKHRLPNPCSPTSSFTICFHSNCLHSTSRLMRVFCLWVNLLLCGHSPPHLGASGVLKACSCWIGNLHVCAFTVCARHYESDQHGPEGTSDHKPISSI